MKKTTILILFSIWTSMTFSQEYYPLIEENKTWNTLSVLYVGPTYWDTTFSTITYQFFGDTIIDTKTYLKLYESEQEIPTDWDFCYYMREDNEKRIWLREEPEDDETLMYDFSAETGDSAFVGINPVYLYIDSISQIEINQTMRNKYWLSCKVLPSYTETWIEGIGSSKGICWSGSVQLVGGWFWFLCMSENGELVYNNPNYESCYLITSINKIDKPIIHIYPNPVKSLLIIENNKNIEIESISLTNINGQIIRLFDTRKTQLDISDIASGLYFLRISYENGKITEKVIIE